MKLDKLETHDRLLSYQKDNENISRGVQECINNVPDAISFPFYVYGHARTVEYDEKVTILKNGQEKAPSTRLIWMPTITKPKSSPNTYLFLCNKGTDVIEIIWMLPKRELWEQYAPGTFFHNESYWTSIQNFLYHKDKLDSPDENGPNPQQQKAWFKIIGTEAHKRKNEKQMYNLINQPEKFEKI